MTDDGFEAEYAKHRRTNEMLREAKRRFVARPFSWTSAREWHEANQAAFAQAPEDYGLCGCSGRRPGEPVCRCIMRKVVAIEGRFVLVRELDGMMALLDIAPAPEGWWDVWLGDEG